jgi:zinc transporter ZupT
LFTTNAVAFDVEIPVAFTTPEPTGTTFWGFTLIGIYVGIIPIYLGIIWFPALRQLSRRWMIFFLALTVGLLIFLGVDTLAEAIEQVEGVPGPFQGVGLIGLGAVATFLLLSAISQRQVAAGKSEVSQRLRLSYMIAVGIGIHNLGEGLAIGAAFNLGEIALGSFLVVGFIIQNITEGLGIIAPILRDRPGIRNLILLGLVGGVPAVVGMWLGGFAPSPTLAVLFLAIGAGAIFGMLLLWITGMFIK